MFISFLMDLLEECIRQPKKKQKTSIKELHRKWLGFNMKQAISPQTAFQDLTFTSVEEFIAKVLHLDRAGLQENFKIQGHENEGYFEYCLLERAIGWGSLHKFSRMEAVLWDRFYPLGRLPKQETPKLKRRGIG